MKTTEIDPDFDEKLAVISNSNNIFKIRDSGYKAQLIALEKEAKMSSKPSSWLYFGRNFGRNLFTVQAVTGVEEA